jgi:putative ABC transport system ATP-binding protein
MSVELIQVRNLQKDYVTGEVVTKVLRGLDFSITAGEYLAIMGPSGSGKSTLMHVLGFLDTATAGAYLFKGQNVAEFDDVKLAEIRNQEVGFVFQQFNLLPKTTVLENVKLPLLYSHHKEETDLARAAIAAVGLEHRTDYLSNQLSGGEKQRVAIARAIVNQPSIVFADEPTGNLDTKSGTQIMEIFEKLNEQGHTIILVTHEQDTANHAHRIIKLRDGLIENDSAVEQRRLVRDGELVK